MSKLNVVVNGAAGVGKDTFVEFAIDELAHCYGLKGKCISSVGAVKAAAKMLGWDGKKDITGRQFLSDLKDMSTLFYDGPMNYMKHEMEDCDVAFLMIREPIEIDRFVFHYPGTMTILISRSGIERFDNHADAEVDEYGYTLRIDNDGSLDDLARKAKAFTHYVLSENNVSYPFENKQLSLPFPD